MNPIIFWILFKEEEESRKRWKNVNLDIMTPGQILECVIGAVAYVGGCVFLGWLIYTMKQEGL